MIAPVKIPITDEIDLHTFRPEEVTELLHDYFLECIKKRLFRVRVVHGKGTGLLKKRVQAVLKNSPLIKDFRDAPSEAGGWGATLVELKTTIPSDTKRQG